MILDSDEDSDDMSTTIERQDNKLAQPEPKPTTQGNGRVPLAPKTVNKRLPQRLNEDDIALYGFKKKRVPAGLEDDDEMLSGVDEALETPGNRDKESQKHLLAPDQKRARKFYRLSELFVLNSNTAFAFDIES